MVIRTAKGGRYRYYICSTWQRMGETACPGRSVRMDMVDKLVIDQFCSRILNPDRLRILLAELLSQNARKADGAGDKKALNKERRAVKGRIARHLELWEDGQIDRDLLKGRLNELNSRLLELNRLIRMLEHQKHPSEKELNPKEIEAFSKVLEERLRDPESAIRKTYLRAFIDRVEIHDKEVRIFGPNEALLKGWGNGLASQKKKVPSFVQEWWAVLDLNQ